MLQPTHLNRPEIQAQALGSKGKPAQILSPEKLEKMKALATPGPEKTDHYVRGGSEREGGTVVAKIRLPKPTEGCEKPSQSAIDKLKAFVEGKHAAGKPEAGRGSLLVEGEGKNLADKEGPSLMQRLQAFFGGEG